METTEKWQANNKLCRRAGALKAQGLLTAFVSVLSHEYFILIAAPHTNN
jgi:hypothetical protein